VRPISEFQHIQFSTEIIGLSVDKKESSHYEAQTLHGKTYANDMCRLTLLRHRHREDRSNLHIRLQE